MDGVSGLRGNLLATSAMTPQAPVAGADRQLSLEAAVLTQRLRINTAETGGAALADIQG